MSGQNVVQFDQNRRAPNAFPEDRTIAMVILLIFDAMILAGMVGIFMLTRAAADTAWPPVGQPWFPSEQMALSSVALIVSGVLVVLAARAWRSGEARRVGPLLFTAIALGAFFVCFQGVMWVSLIRRGLDLASSQHANFFCVVTGMHGANAVTALVLLSLTWMRLKPLRDGGGPRGSLNSTTFAAARILWYFVVGVWPVLFALLYR